MAKRIGKYKLTKRDSALSLIDGGKIIGNLNVSSLVGAQHNPGIAGQLFVTGSVVQPATNNGSFTGSAFVVLASQG